MNPYVLVATSAHFGGDTQIKHVKANTDVDARALALEWQRKDLGFDWSICVGRVVYERV